MTKETFILRLKKIKELEETLNRKHDVMVEGNPFVEDGSGVMPDWLMNLIFEHVLTLFAAVNEDAFYKTKLDDCKESYPGMSVEEIAKEIGISVEKLKSSCENTYVLADLVDYFLYEMDWGGRISIGKDDSDTSRDYDFSDYGRLYDYIKEEI